jgi:hypothetical protein
MAALAPSRNALASDGFSEDSVRNARRPGEHVIPFWRVA